MLVYRLHKREGEFSFLFDISLAKSVSNLCDITIISVGKFLVSAHQYLEGHDDSDRQGL